MNTLEDYYTHVYVIVTYLESFSSGILTLPSLYPPISYHECYKNWMDRLCILTKSLILKHYFTGETYFLQKVKYAGILKRIGPVLDNFCKPGFCHRSRNMAPLPRPKQMRSNKDAVEADKGHYFKLAGRKNSLFLLLIKCFYVVSNFWSLVISTYWSVRIIFFVQNYQEIYMNDWKNSLRRSSPWLLSLRVEWTAYKLLNIPL